MNLIYKIILVCCSFFVGNATYANDQIHYICSFDGSYIVDSTGVYEGKKWESRGFTIKGEWLVLDGGNLKLKLTTNIQKYGVSILRGGEYPKGYQFSLENEKFVYVILIVPQSASWTITGSCKME